MKQILSIVHLASQDQEQEKKPWRQQQQQHQLQQRCNKAKAEPGPQAHQTFAQVERMGPAMHPLEFSRAQMFRAKRDRNAVIVGIDNHPDQDPTSLSSSPAAILCEQGVIYQLLAERSDANNSQVQFGYWPVKRLQRAFYGFIWACVEVRKVPQQPITSSSSFSSFWEPVHAYPTIAMKILDRKRILNERHSENPHHEISALQYLHQPSQEEEDNRGREHIVESKVVLFDAESLYCAMPLCRGGDLFDVVRHYRRQNGEKCMGMPEPVARYCFRQILWGLHYLQTKGICHRDLSLENVLVDGDVCKIIDFGMALRIPYRNYNSNCVGQTKFTHWLELSGAPQLIRRRIMPQGAIEACDEPKLIRRLMPPQGPCGKRNYMSPEIRRNKDNIDGFAVDLWCVGVMLFVMLTGKDLFQNSNRSDIVFCFVAMRGELHRILGSHLGVFGLSDSVVNLLQNMLHENPRRRLTLAQVMAHEWTLAEPVQAPQRLHN